MRIEKIECILLIICIVLGIRNKLELALARARYHGIAKNHHKK
jgi:hypothetical protein